MNLFHTVGFIEMDLRTPESYCSFFGWLWEISLRKNSYVMKGFLPDFCIALIWRRKVPHGWYHRDGFTHSRKLLLLFWLVMGNFILLGYKGTLLSNLIRVRYEPPIESYDDVLKSGLKFLLGEFPGSEEWIDAHPYVSQMANNLIRFSVWDSDRSLDWYTEWYGLNT